MAQLTSNMADGSPLMVDAVIHDHENSGYGAQSVLCIGDRGTGKTTLMQRMLQRATYLESPKVSKRDYLLAYKNRRNAEQVLINSGKYSFSEIRDKLPKLPTNEIPETVLYSGREFDYWHNFIASEPWSDDFEKRKPVCIHLPKGEEFHFVLQINGVIKDMDFSGLTRTYSSPRDLISHIQEQAINVWYPPAEYQLSSLLTEQPEIKIGGKRIYENVNPKWMNFDLVYHCMQYRYQKHLIWFADEIHSILPGSSSDIEWHILDWYSRCIDPELRRCHISSFGTTHACQLVDSRYMQRATWYIWTGGAVPQKKLSIVKPSAALRCCAGSCIIERKGQFFGRYSYDRLHGQLPKLRIVRGGIDEIKL